MNLARRPQIETYLFSALAKMQLEVKKKWLMAGVSGDPKYGHLLVVETWGISSTYFSLAHVSHAKT